MDRDFNSTAWADGHQHLTDAISSGFKKLADAFERLQAIRFAAPWHGARR